MRIVLIHYYLQHLKLYCLLIGVLSHPLKLCFTYTPQISLFYDNIEEIITSNILQAREGFNLLKSREELCLLNILVKH